MTRPVQVVEIRGGKRRPSSVPAGRTRGEGRDHVRSIPLGWLPTSEGSTTFRRLAYLMRFPAERSPFSWRPESSSAISSDGRDPLQQFLMASARPHGLEFAPEFLHDCCAVISLRQQLAPVSQGLRPGIDHNVCSNRARAPSLSGCMSNRWPRCAGAKPLKNQTCPSTEMQVDMSEPFTRTFGKGYLDTHLSHTTGPPPGTSCAWYFAAPSTPSPSRPKIRAPKKSRPFLV